MSELNRQSIQPAQWAAIMLAIASAAGTVLYYWIRHLSLGHTAAMFIGIPMVLAILLACTPKQQTVTGGILKGITLGLLIVAPILREGFVCILFASPLFYIVGIIIGLAADRATKRPTSLFCTSLVLLPMCLEGVFPATTWNRSQSVTVTTVVRGSSAAVEHALAQSPNVRQTLPAYLAIGFPRPLQAFGEGLFIGATRTIHFSGAEAAPEGDLVMRVTDHRTEYGGGYVRYQAVSDASKLTQWLHWDSSEVSWQPIDQDHTRVTWCIHFERELDPAWYFIPWERAAVHEAARFLIQANATPEGQQP